MAKCLFAKKINIKRNEADIMANYKANQIYAPCRKCFNCQMNTRRQEIKRVLDEAKYYKYHLMITLTYNNKNIRLRNYIDEVLNDTKLLSKDKYEKLIIFDKVVDFIRNYKNEDEKNNKVNEIEKLIYYHLINEYATLHYNDIKKYLNTLKKAIKRDKTCINKDFKYYGCGEYPHIKVNRGRPHYHLIILFEDIEIIKHFIKAWNYGNITIKRGDNQIDESLNLLTLPRPLYISDKLNCICKQETKKDDIKRIYDYIKNKKIKLENKNAMAEILYIAGYTNKKAEATLFESIRKRNNEIKKYWTIKDIFEEIDYKQVRQIMKMKRKQELKDRKNGKIGIEKEEPFRFKSQKIGLRYAIDNKKQFINDPTYYSKSGRTLIPNYYIKAIIKNEMKENKSIEANTILYNKNKIVSELNIKKLKEYKKDGIYKYNADYEIKKYFDETIDIIDTTNKDEPKNIYVIEKIHNTHKQNTIDAKKIMFGEKEEKSDLFKVDYYDLLIELQKHKDDLNEYVINILNKKYDNSELIKTN